VLPEMRLIANMRRHARSSVEFKVTHDLNTTSFGTIDARRDLLATCFGHIDRRIEAAQPGDVRYRW
jgi:hypothetical protein